MSPKNTENDLHKEMKRLQDTVLWHDHPKGKLSNCRNDKCNGNLQHMTRVINCTFQLFFLTRGKHGCSGARASVCVTNDQQQTQTQTQSQTY